MAAYRRLSAPSMSSGLFERVGNSWWGGRTVGSGSDFDFMEDDYYSIDSILSENQVLCLFISCPDVPACIHPTSTQKIRCTFKVDIPDMGHLDGGHERDVRTRREIASHIFFSSQRLRSLDQSSE